MIEYVMDVWLWVGFTLFILLMLALDLGLLQRRPHVIGIKEALAWFAVWIGLALLFNIGLFLFNERGSQAGLEFLAGFLVEKSLSIDNVFVFILIFNYFRVPAAYQHKVLFWGILGAILLRVIFILGGLAMIARFHWTVYLFGLFLIATGIGMMRKREAKYDPKRNWVIRQFRRFFPVTGRYSNSHFFARQGGRLLATPLFIVLLAIESSDIVFAADSIPAIFAVTPDPFIVYTSNIFAMLGLRSLYFAVSGVLQMFHFLHYGFASIITLLGLKMLLSDVYKMPIELSLILIVVILLVCVIVSLLWPRRADLKGVFKRTERLGLIPFRRLLMIENIVELGDLKARNAMHELSHVRTINLSAPWEENLKVIRETRYSRYPIVEAHNARPVGIMHVKDLVLNGITEPSGRERLRKLARPSVEIDESVPLEEALRLLQRRSAQMALVFNEKGEWTGIVTLEDMLEEIVGRMGDEFEQAYADGLTSLADALSPGRIVLQLQAESLTAAIRDIIARIPQHDLPGDPHTICCALLEAGETVASYVSKGLAIRHAPWDGVDRPILAFARSDAGIELEGTNERPDLIFLLLTPPGKARIRMRLLADIAELFESEYVTERLRKAMAPNEILEAIRAGQEIAID